MSYQNYFHFDAAETNGGEITLCEEYSEDRGDELCIEVKDVFDDDKSSKVYLNREQAVKLKIVLEDLIAILKPVKDDFYEDEDEADDWGGE